MQPSLLQALKQINADALDKYPKITQNDLTKISANPNDKDRKDKEDEMLRNDRLRAQYVLNRQAQLIDDRLDLFLSYYQI